VDCQAVVEGKARVAAREVGDGVPFQLPGERGERVREVVQEREHLLRREQVFHHHEAHQMQAKVTRDRGRCHGVRSQSKWAAWPAWVGSYTRRCRAGWPSRPAGAAPQE